MRTGRTWPNEVHAYALQAWASGKYESGAALARHMATLFSPSPGANLVRSWIAGKRSKPAAQESAEVFGLRMAREGYTLCHIREACSRRGTPITINDAQRMIREARLSGMKLYTTTTPGPWRTSAGHTVTQEGGAYCITAPGWEHPITFRATGFSNAVAHVERHLGPMHLYVDGVYADDEDPENDLYDEEGLEHLPLLRGADMRRAA